MKKDSNASGMVDHDAPVEQRVDMKNFPFYDTLQWEPLDIPVDSCATEKIRLNGRDQPDLWAYLQYQPTASDCVEANTTIEIYDDNHNDNPLIASDFLDLELLVPYRWICSGTTDLISSVHALKAYLSASFIIRGYEMAETLALDPTFSCRLNYAEALIEKGRAAEGKLSVGDIKPPSYSLNSETLDWIPSSPLSSASDTSEPDREALEDALCHHFGTSALPFMSALQWIRNERVPTGERLRVGNLDGQPVFADFTPGAIESLEILIRQGEKLLMAKTIRKREFDKIDWNTPFSYIVDGEELRNFLKGLFVLEGHSSGELVEIDEKTFCGVVKQIISNTEIKTEYASPSLHSRGKGSSSRTTISNVEMDAGGSSDGMIKIENDEPESMTGLSFHSTQEYPVDKGYEVQPMLSVRSIPPSPDRKDLAAFVLETERFEPQAALEWNDVAFFRPHLHEDLDLSELIFAENRVLARDDTAEQDDVSLLIETCDMLTTYYHVTTQSRKR